MISAGATHRETYYSVRNLAWAVWPNHDPSRCLMAIYAYYDASGKEESHSRPLVVAGLVASLQRWQLFERVWSQTLKEFDVPYLHMREFAHSVKDSPFEKWKGDEDRRVAFISKLADIMRGTVEQAFLYTLVPKHYYAVDAVYRLREVTGGPYAMAAAGCVQHASLWSAGKYPGVPIEHTVEAGDSGQNVFQTVLHMYGMHAIVKPKQDDNTGLYILPFQAADFFAYEHGLLWNRILVATEPAVRLRKSCEAVRRISHEWKTLGEAGLRRLCESRPHQFPLR